jgi:hypothetical protein
MYHLNISNQVFSNLPIVRRATGVQVSTKNHKKENFIVRCAKSILPEPMARR